MITKNASCMNNKVESFLSLPLCVDFILELRFSAPWFLLFCQKVTFLFDSILMQDKNKDALKNSFKHKGDGFQQIILHIYIFYLKHFVVSAYW